MITPGRMLSFAAVIIIFIVLAYLIFEVAMWWLFDRSGQ